ncbi:MAG: hypothetical protein K0U84_20760 [Actinomycetia bacterium]|nr:hypothetical protein [Actinomycetes bacterium]
MAQRSMWDAGVKIHPMELHDNPQLLVETFVEQHGLVLGETHGDLCARLAEVPDRFVDQGDAPRGITVSCTLLETLLFSRWRRQTESSTLKAIKGNGFGIVLIDGKGTRIGVRKHPRNWDGSLLAPVPYAPGGDQLSFEEELGHPIGGEDGIPEPPGYRQYVLWWPGSLGLGGAVLAAGVLTDTVQVLYASTPLPEPIMEQRSKTVSMRDALAMSAEQETSGKRRRDEDFAGIDGVTEDAQEEAPPESS